MDLELGLKITKTREDIASISEYRLAKAGPVFQFRETNTMFILTAHLKGYKRNNININISEDGSKISVSGEKPIQNILMMGWLMHRTEVDVAGFNKVFKIPDGVKLDGIKAKYDEEEWMLNIFLPKLVKGICGVKIEEIKEEEPDRGKSELEKSEGDHILRGVGETSQKRSKESEVQAMEENEGGVSEKMFDDANREIIKETIQKEVEESKLGIEGGIGENFGEKGGMEGYEAMKRSELEQNVGEGTSRKIGDTSQKEIEESKMRIKDGVVKEKREKVGNIEFEEVKTTEMEDNGGFLEEEKVVTEKRIDDGNGNIIGEVIQKEIEESKSGIVNRGGQSVKEKIGKAGDKRVKTSKTEQNVGAHETYNIGDTSQGASKESVIEQMGEDKSSVEKMENEECGEMLAEANVSTKEEIPGESKQKQFGEPKSETEDRLEESEKESRMKLDQNVDDHIPINISKEEFKKSKIQPKEKTESIEENMDGRESERMPVEASEDSQKHVFGDSIQRDIKMSKIETEDGDQEYVGEKDDKEEFNSMITIREEFPQQLPEAAIEESKGLSGSKLQETEDVKEARIKRKPKEIEYFVDKGEGEQPRKMHIEEKKDLTKEKMKESEDVKEAMVKRKGKEIDYFVGEGQGEEPKRMHKKEKDSTTKTTQETEDVKEVMVKRKKKEDENFADKGEGKEPKRMRTEAKKDLTKETMQESEDVKETMVKRKDKEIDYSVDKGQGEELKRTHMEAKKDTEKETMQEEIEKIKNEIKDNDQQNVPVGRKLEVPTAELPKLVGGEDGSRGLKIAMMDEQKEMIKEPMARSESLMETTKGKKSKTEEAGRFTEKNTATEILGKGTEEYNIERMSRGGPCVADNMVKVLFEVLGTFQAELPKQLMEAIAQNKKDKNEYVVVKLKGEGSIKMHVQPNEAFDEDETEDRIKKEITKPKLKSTDQIVDSLAKTREEPKDKEIEEVARRKSEETEVAESTTEEKVQETESERSSMTFKEVPEDKHPKVLKIGSPEGELQSTKGPTTHEKVVNVGFKEVGQERAKDTTQKTKLLPPTIQNKETRESKFEGVKQDTIKPKKARKVEGEQSSYNIESTKEVARLPSTQQIKVEEKDKLYEGEKAEASGESEKRDTSKDMKNLTDMKENQESKPSKTLEPEIPLKTHLKKERKVTRKDDFPKGQNVRETIQEKTEGPKDKIVDRDQKYVLRDLGKGVGKVIGKDMPKKEYVADVDPVAQRMETKGDFKATPEREKHTIAQNVEDEKARIQQENIKADVEKVGWKGYQTKAVEEGMLKGEYRAEVVPEKEREKPKVAKSEEAKEASTLPLKREIGKIAQTAEDKKPKMEETTPEFEKPSEFKQVAEKMHVSHEREQQRESEVTPKTETKPPTITPKKGVGKPKEEMLPMPKAIQKEPHELSLPSKYYKIPKIEEVQQKNEGERTIHALEATTSKEEEELAQATATHSKAKCEIDESQDGHGTHEIEEENGYGQGDEVDQEDFQLLEELSEYEEEATGEENNQKRSKKLFVSVMIAGSALLASGIFLIIRHKRAKNSAK